jgi:hypothetical protein
VHHRTVSGAPGWINSNLPASEILGSRSTIIHRTVRCDTGLSGVPAEQRLLRANGRLQGTVKANSARLRAQKSKQALEGAPDSEQDLSSAHRTVRWPNCQKLQRSEPNDLMTWLAHRTVSGGAPDCPVHHTTEAFTNIHFGGLGYKYPQPPHFNAIQVSAICIQYKSSRLHSKTQTKRSNPLPSPKFIPIK